MARVLQVLVEAPRPCSYLEDREASLEHRVIVDGTADELEEMLARGWRRFGPDHFRPKCGSCSSCVPTRVPIADYKLSKSERRAMKANAEFRVEIARPKVDAARLHLHARWHEFREDSRGWTPTDIDPHHYALSFAYPHPSVIEISTWQGDRLISIAITDETPSAWSAVYFFYDPEHAHRSPGIANVVRQIELARAREKRHLYLGFLVEESASMAYKARFRPAEALDGWPSDGETPVWRLAR
jgi:arginyl-tRNA--protein-N-Asp/Glu arginylyltransferase